LKKNKLYIILPIIIFAILFITTITCNKQEETNKANYEAKVDQSYEDIKKESTVVDDKGSTQSEDVQDLDKQDRAGSVTLNGQVECRNEISGSEEKPISITIDWDKNSVGGNTTLLWYEYIEVSGEGGETHHTHKYVCRVEFKGTILGSIDKNDNVKATISGNTSSDYGYNPQSEEYSLEICDLCEEKLNNKFKTFTLIGKYTISNTGVVEKVEGKIAENGWEWKTMR